VVCVAKGTEFVPVEVLEALLRGLEQHQGPDA